MDAIEPRRFRVLLIPEGVSPLTGINWSRNKLAQLTVEEPGTYYIVKDFSFAEKTDLTKLIGYVEDLHLGEEGLYGLAKLFTPIRQAIEVLESYGIPATPVLKAAALRSPSGEIKLQEFKLVGVA